MSAPSESSSTYPPLPPDTAVLLIGHGSVERAEDIPAFVSNIRRGRPTPQAIVDEVTHRWTAIGGSPLQAISRAQAAALQQRLGVPVVVAGRLFHPYAQEVVAGLAARGARRVLSLPVAPYSVAIYNETTRAACSSAGVSCVESPPWGGEPALIDAFADVTRDALGALEARDEARREAAHVLFTAHSLPTRVIAAGDAYEREVRATGALVASALGRSSRTSIAFQSQGMDGGEWLGPDLVTALDALARDGIRDVVVTAIGFLADHTEVLYDLDVEARALAEARGLSFTRAASLNVHPRFIDALEGVARRALET